MEIEHELSAGRRRSFTKAHWKLLNLSLVNAIIGWQSLKLLDQQQSLNSHTSSSGTMVLGVPDRAKSSWTLKKTTRWTIYLGHVYIDH